MSQKKVTNPGFKPEKDENAATKMEHEIPFKPDGMDQFSMFFMAMMTVVMRMDPIALWCVFFVLLSISLNKGSNGTILSQSLMSTVVCLFSILVKYYQIISGAAPIPKKWEFN